jgi:hypothetical protein
MSANLPQQQQQQPQHNILGRHPTASPSFSPQQMQRGVEVVNAGSENVMSPMVMQPQAQPPPQPNMNTAAQRQQQQNQLVFAAMNSCGLGGRDYNSLTPDERVCIDASEK